MTEALAALEGQMNTLAGLRVGEPLLFLLLAQVEPGYPPLLVQPGARETSTDRLVTMAARLPGAAGPFVTGTGWFGDTGALHLRAAELDRQWLERLAAWTRGAAEDSAKVGLLVDTRLVQPDPFGGSPEVHRDPSLWGGVRAVRPKREGSPSHTAEELRTLSPGARARFWLGGPRWGDPVLVLVPVDGDPQGDRFQERVRDARTRGLAPRGDAIQGVLQRLSGGRLTLTSDATAATLAASLRAAVTRWAGASPALWELLDARCVQRLESGLSDPAAPQQPRDLSTLARVLPQLADGRSSARAWFTARSDDGTPHLLVARSDADRDRAAEAVGGEGPAVAGVLRWDAEGSPQFVCSRPPADLAAQVAGWAVAWRFACPALVHLRGLTVAVPEGDGERTLDPDPALWGPFGD